MKTTTSTKPTGEATPAKRDPKSGRFVKSTARAAKPVTTTKPMTTTAKKG